MTAFIMKYKRSSRYRVLGILAGLMIFVLAGCGVEAEPIEDSRSQSSLSKLEARERIAKQDDVQEDYCELNNWYNDGVCDRFCLQPDPDCAQCPDTDVPTTSYIAESLDDPSICASIRFSCEEGERPFNNSICGCGCVPAEPLDDEPSDDESGDDKPSDETPAECPDASDSSVHYMSDSQDNPSVCATIRFSCDDGQTLFSNQTCGCGCIDSDDSGVDPVDPADPIEPDVECNEAEGLFCEDGQYCEYVSGSRETCGEGGLNGVCKPSPEICTREYAPVCGCDGVTYSNSCTALANGASVAYRDECIDDSVGQKTCGGPTDIACAEGYYCDYDGEIGFCGDAPQLGTCVKNPQFCTREYAPVCGCNGQTYGNACMAAQNGAAIAYEGECTTDDIEPAQCGGPDNLSCRGNQYCDFGRDIGICGPSETYGQCEDRPVHCTREYAPVCGCDGQTYGNACMAAFSGAAIASQGECVSEPTGAPCGGPDNLSCRGNEYCDFGDEVGICGASDTVGICTQRPEMCAMIYAPVCGCDGETYGNSCVAARAGVAIESEGRCGGEVVDTIERRR